LHRESFLFFFEILMNNLLSAWHTTSDRQKEMKRMLDKIALSLAIIGALNWGSIGLFQFDIVGWIFGGQSAIISRIIYTVVALAGIWCISLLFRENEVLARESDQ
jgi:hypothetical protein